MHPNHLHLIQTKLNQASYIINILFTNNHNVNIIIIIIIIILHQILYKKMITIFVFTDGLSIYRIVPKQKKRKKKQPKKNKNKKQNSSKKKLRLVSNNENSKSEQNNNKKQQLNLNIFHWTLRSLCPY